MQPRPGAVQQQTLRASLASQRCRDQQSVVPQAPREPSDGSLARVSTLHRRLAEALWARFGATPGGNSLL